MQRASEPVAQRTPGAAAWLRHPPHGLPGAAFWLALWFVGLWIFRVIPGVSYLLGTRGLTLFVTWMQVLVGLALFLIAIPLALRLIRRHFLWSLRNRLVLTYLLIGLAPVVLFVTLVAISAYIAAGQFSIHLADTRMRQELDAIGAESAFRADRLAGFLRFQQLGQRSPVQPQHTQPPPSTAESLARAASPLAAQLPAQPSEPQAPGETVPNPLRARLHRHTVHYLNGAPLSQDASLPGISPPETTTGATVPLGLPPWVADLRGREFRGLVIDGDDLFLIAIDQRRIQPGGELLSVITSLPVDSALIDLVAQGLGRVRLAALMTSHSRPAPAASTRRRSLGSDIQRTSIFGGTEPPPVNFYDLRVPFVSTMDIVDWDSGDTDNVPIEVHSRPSLLYRQLFGSSIGGIVTDYIRIGLIALCILFAIIEALALWMALRLSASMTASVSELYKATQDVDRGDLSRRIPPSVAAQQDQLGDLARSFNRMTGSLARLLDSQKEKERLQSELSIAQEVQANLFPQHARNLANLELHGICRPARSVSGDYYDFLVFHHRDVSPSATFHHHNGHARESGVGIVLGDISGKGISAALLMATLHSAVRAYRFASEDLVYSDHSFASIAFPNPSPDRDELAEDTGKLFESPGRILALLNRHLYRSTQPEKYATLFLSHYDAATAQLTYSNAGHLPPLVLGRDNRVRRLDCGGTVVGLMDGMTYEQATIQMNSGDVLVAYSDGVTEPENDFGDFGEDRLLEVVARYRDQPLSVISAQVMLALDAWIGAAEQPDDITLVLARQL